MPAQRGTDSALSSAKNVFADTSRAIKALRLRSTLLSRPPLTHEDKLWLMSMATEFRRSLTRVAREFGATNKQRSMAEGLIFNAFAAKVCAVVRALDQRGEIPDRQHIIKLARGLDIRGPLTEPVRAWWEPKNSGFRLICSDGPRRMAQRLLLRDALLLMGVESEVDVTRKEGGGERAFVKIIVEAMGEGYEWWSTPDVKECFPSLRPGHFGWLPITVGYRGKSRSFRSANSLSRAGGSNRQSN
jgi:hypothetical protein